MKRRTLLTVSALGMLALAGCGRVDRPQPSPSSGPVSPDEVTIGLSYVPNIQFAPFYVADANGLFDEVPSRVSLRHHGANEALFTALSAGREQFLVAGGAEAMQTRDAGIETVAVAAYYKAFPIRILVLGDSPITGLADLAGRSIGVPGRFGESWLGLLVALNTAGLSESDVDIVEIGYTQLSALTTGKVDAIVGFSTNELVQIQEADPASRALPIASGTVPLVSTCLLTTPDFAAEHPDVVRAVVDSMTAGIEAAAADPARTLDLSGAYIPGLDGQAKQNSAAVLDASIDLMQLQNGRFDPRLDEAQWAAMSSFLADNGLTEAPVDPTEMASNEFAA